MRNHKLISQIVAAWTCMLLTSCASTHEPSRWLPEPNQATTNAYGGWIEIESRQAQIMGELIAIDKDTAFVANTTMYAIATSDIRSARLVYYNAGSSIGWGTFFGTISTLSNGLWLVITAPMWIIGGTIASSSRTFDSVIDYPDKPFIEFAPFARFPQGLPPHVDRDKIIMKLPQ